MEEENKRIIEFFVKIDKELLFVNNFWNTQRARSINERHLSNDGS